MNVAVIVFPGSNCDHDAWYAASSVAGMNARLVWHKEGSIGSDTDVVIIPGGFSFGDYLRCGAVARFSPVMKDVVSFANRGGHVLGICNGFQVLTEAGLVPGSLLRNTSLNFVCKTVFLRAESAMSPFTKGITSGSILSVPIAHGEGNYFADASTLDSMEANGQIAFRYCNANGEIDDMSNPNGSIGNIAGVTNERGNVLGMMPHPERACEQVLGSSDGLAIFASIRQHLQ